MLRCDRQDPLGVFHLPGSGVDVDDIAQILTRQRFAVAAKERDHARREHDEKVVANVMGGEQTVDAPATNGSKG
jgi:hypothetical protein